MNNTIAIFNGFPFHYEVFGYILEFAKRNKYFLDIYTNISNDLGWFDFYKSIFTDFKLFHFCEFKGSSGYDFVFLTTDDDRLFRKEWVNDSVICINHRNEIRNPFIKKQINIASFRDSSLEYTLPCYDYLQISDKIQTDYISIAVVGGNLTINYSVINRFKSSLPIKLFIFSRKNTSIQGVENINDDIMYSIEQDINTFKMMEILKQCQYIFVNAFNCQSHRPAISSSGSLGLCYTTLCKPILFEETNDYLGLLNCVSYREDTSDIYLELPDYQELYKEREYYIEKFQGIVHPKKSIPKILFQTWETKDFDKPFQEIVDTWKIKNPEYIYKLCDSKEREVFLRTHFNKEVYDTYNKIIPGAYKADLWRYCILYIYGGVFVDIDSLCLGNLSTFLDTHQHVFLVDFNESFGEGNHNLANGFIGIIPYSPIMEYCINKIVHNVKTNTIPPSKLDFSGPGLLGRSVNTFLKLKETSSFVGKEGVSDGIHLLKFHREGELVKNENGDTLFQNKNGNQIIVRLYNEECKKVRSVSWVNSHKIFC